MVLIAILVAGCTPQQESQPPSAIDSTVNITDGSGNHSSLGTQINSDTVLTHNHFSDPLSSYSVVDSTGLSQPFNRAASDTVGQGVIINQQDQGEQTRLVTFPNELAGDSAHIASQRTINGLQLGDSVEIAYWDDVNNRLASGLFLLNDIGNLENGAISVDDSLGVLNPGDSGGGVYYNGELIGNLWSISGGNGHIALTPQEVNERSRVRTRVR